MNDTPFAAGAVGRAPVHQRTTASIIRETSAVIVGLAGAFITVSLIAGAEGRGLTGPVGVGIATTLLWLLGSIVAFTVPAFVFWFAVQLYLGRPTGWRFSRVAGILMLMMGATGAIALPTADDPLWAEDTFLRAGAIGTFLVEWEGLRLVGSFGMLGAGFILGAMMLIGVVMMTQYDITTIMALMTRRVKPSELEPLAESAAAAPPPVVRTKETKAPVAAAKGAAPAARKTLMPLPEDDDPLEHLEADEPRRPGLLGRLFGRREPVLPDPDPSESHEIPLTDFSDGYDADALAAARALEEARIDEEYERALREESYREPVAVVEEQQEIVFRDCTGEVELKAGNPKNDEDGDVLAGGLAKLFPSRWEKEPGTAGATRREKSEPAIRSAAEARAFRRTADGMELDGTMPSASLGMDSLSGENDPLFDPDLETRPAGVEGALRAREVSAVALQEAEDERIRRSRELAGYRLPDIALLNVPPRIDNRMTREEMMEISQTLERTFADFNIEARVVEIMQGPVVTRFELKPAPGVKVSRIVSLEHDISMAMQAESVRIVAPIPGKAAVGIEIPNKNRQGVYFKELVSCTEFWDHPSPLAFALGKTIDGQPYFADLKKMPHLLIAGATGAGKSVCLNTIICSMLYRMRPDRLRLLMVDPKRVELSIYQDIPHLISPVVCDAKRAAAALNWAVEQMEERYQKLVDFNVRNIDGYNEIATNPEKAARFRGRNLDPMPHMVVIVDELADLMVVAKNEVEESIQRLAQMSRAVGIHLILATQRPSVNVITGIIKANFPTRIAFQVSQKVDSRTILDSNGAEALLGRGDMLFAPAGAGKPIRVQGCFLSDDEVERIAATCRDQIGPMYEVEEFEPMLSEKEQRELAKLMGAPTDMDELDMQGGMAAASRGTNRTMGKVSAGMFVPHDGGSAQAGEDEIDEALVRAAARLILEARKGSTSLVQRRLKVGFARAGRLMDMLEEMGIVGPYKGSKPRDLLVDPDAALAQLDQLEMQIAASGGNSRRAAELLDGDPSDEEFPDEEYDEDDERR